MVSGTKDPARVQSGRRGAEIRWGNTLNRRVVRLDALEPSVAAAVRALLEADRHAKAVREVEARTAGTEVQRGSAERSAA